MKYGTDGIRITFTLQEKTGFFRGPVFCKEKFKKVFREKLLIAILERYHGRTDSEVREEMSVVRFSFVPETRKRYGDYRAKVIYSLGRKKWRHSFFVNCEPSTLEARVYTNERRLLSS